MKYSAIVLGAGKGSRTNLGYNKVFHHIENGQIMIVQSMQYFINDPECSEVILVLAKADIAHHKEIEAFEKLIIVEGGKTRQASVYSALREVHEAYVLIHDGARPFLKNEQITNIKAGLVDCDACLLAVPAIDSIKLVKNGFIEKSLERDRCYLAQTPQAFRTQLIRECHAQALKENLCVSDDVTLVEKYSNTLIKIVEGDYSNKKITVIEDLN